MFEGIKYLLCALGDGTFFYFIMDSSGTYFISIFLSCLFSFVETPRKFIIANLKIYWKHHVNLLFTWCFHKAKQVYSIHHANVQETYFSFLSR